MRKRLFVFDLDETLFTHDYSKLSIHIRDKEGNIVNSISYKFFALANYTLPELTDELWYDFSDWQSSCTFQLTAKPVKTMINMMNAYVKQKDTTVEILTARRDFDNVQAFAEHMANCGIDIQQVHVRRAGNNMKTGYDVAMRKKHLIGCEVMLNDYTDVTFYDDNLDNLHAFLDLKEIFPWLTLVAYQVNVNSDSEILRRIEHVKCEPDAVEVDLG